MIDIEALAVPAFLVEIAAGGAPAGASLNAAAQAHSELVRCLTATPEEGKGIDAKDGGSVAAGLRRCVDKRMTADVAVTVAEDDGQAHWWATLAPMTDRDGRVTTLLGICREVSQQERDTARNSDHLSLALQAIHGAEWCYEMRYGTYQGSNEIATLLGEPVPRPVAWAEWLERVYPQDLGLFLAAPEPDGVVEFRFHAADGELRWARCSRVAMTDDAGKVEAVLGIMVDITPERVRETAWAELATHDPLTGLLNRRGLRQEFDRMQAELPPSSSVALFAVDLDHFKTTNDTHGHAAGDAVLVEAARRLAATIEGAACARLGGDEFVAVLSVPGEAEAEEMRARLQQSFRRPLAFCGHWLPVSASVGAAFGSADVARLMDNADADLYGRKRAEACTRAVAA